MSHSFILCLRLCGIRYTMENSEERQFDSVVSVIVHDLCQLCPCHSLNSCLYILNDFFPKHSMRQIHVSWACEGFPDLCLEFFYVSIDFRPETAKWFLFHRLQSFWIMYEDKTMEHTQKCHSKRYVTASEIKRERKHSNILSYSLNVRLHK